MIELREGWVDPTAGRAEVAGRKTTLSPRERALLAHLLGRHGQVVPREELLIAVWGPDAGSLRAVDTVVRRLRTKLEVEPAHPAHLLTVHGEGYQLVTTAPESVPVAAPRPALRLGTCTFDPVRREFTDDRGPVALTPRESGVLEALVETPQRPVTRSALLLAVWGYRRQSALRYVDATVRGLRAKIEPDPKHPVRIRAVAGVGYVFVPPTAAPTGNLGAETSRFFGRGDLLDALEQAWAEGARLCTLVGPGGIGKTRLARHWCQRRIGGHPVWFVDLTTCTSVTEVMAAVAATLGARPDLPVTEASVAQLLTSKGGFLVLDNAEQVEPGLGRMVEGWLGRTRTLWVLVTSRRRLGAVDELVLELASLDDESASALFTDRVRRQQPRWDPEPHRGDIAELVRRLDGLPLAIELAAARAGVRTPADLLAALEQRFSLLARGDRSLWASLSLSWEVLSPEEQRAFALLCAFRGGFFLEDFGDADLLEGLVDQSMVRVVPTRSHGVRFDLYVSIRELAQQKLPERWLEQGRQRHAQRFVEVARAWTEEFQTRGRRDVLEILHLQRPNLEAAIQATLDNDPETAAHCLVALARLSTFRPAATSRVLEWIERCLPRVPPTLRARLGTEQAVQLGRAGRLDAAIEAVERAAGLPADADTRLDALAYLHLLTFRDLDDIAEPLLPLATDTGRASWWRARAEVATQRGLYDQARSLHERTRDLYQRLGNTSEQTRQRFNLATVDLLQGRPDRGIDALRHVVAHYETTGDRWAVAKASITLGSAQAELGDPDADRTLWRAMQVFHELGPVLEEARALSNLGNVARDRGEPLEARELHRAALRLTPAAAPSSLLLCHLNLAVDEAEVGTPERVAASLDAAERIADGIGSLRGRAAVAALRALVLGSASALDLARDLATGASTELEALVTAAGGIASFEAGDRATAAAALEALEEPARVSQMARWAARTLASRLRPDTT